ncbi:MAG: PAS domain S-box protein [Anaerolineae bacterium]|nr:PAS domain S-box protein [Anaerolineae bacterium]MDK1080673.1 PAS domain S-box protein [Anaerolineae bacterium]
MNNSSPPVKVLIIEDEEAIRMSFADYMEDRGFEVLIAENGRIGIEVLKQKQPDIVLVDLRMPEMNGLEFMIMAKPIAPDVPVIVISGANRIDEVVKAQQLGSSDYLVKPVNELSLLGFAVDKALERARLIQENRKYQKDLEELVQVRTANLEKANLKLAESEERYRLLAENALDFIWKINMDMNFVYASNSVSELLGYSPNEILKMNNKDIYTPKEYKKVKKIITKELSKEAPHYGITFQSFHQHKDGREIPVEISAKIIYDDNWKPISIQGSTYDLTERLQAEQQLRLQATALESAANAIVITNRTGSIEWVNPAFTELTGYKGPESLARNLRELVRSDLQDDAFYNEMWETVTQGKVWHGDLVNRRKDGSLYIEEQTITPVHNTKGDITHFVTIKQDITDRKEYEQELETVAAVSAALRGATTRSEMLPVILDQLLTLLNVEGANIVMSNGASGEMVTELGRGVWASLTGMHIPAGSGVSAKVLRDGSPYLNNNAINDKNFYRPIALEVCTAIAGVPLKVGDYPNGVLWIGSSRPLSEHHLRLLTVIADMAANALHRADLFNDLERTNEELIQSYDATIEGWARVLEQRDLETEGHSKRVAELSMRLATKVGINDEELIHVRRGALLHDIGKIGIPDIILHKTGALTEKEWEEMHGHPKYAHDWLSTIEFLQPALNIPYTHHEKWDGTGYPRGLKGKDIPHEVRVFSIVDVWDALRSDRPYRKAWSNKKALEYIQDQSGKHFDPKVVKAFLDIIKSNGIEKST